MTKDHKEIKLVCKHQDPTKDVSFCIFDVSGGEVYKIEAIAPTLKGLNLDLETACRIALECHLEHTKILTNKFDVRDYYLEVRDKLMTK